MIDTLTRNPLVGRLIQRTMRGWAVAVDYSNRADKGALALKAFIATVFLGIALLFASTLLEYRHAIQALKIDEGNSSLRDLPSLIPLVSQGMGTFIALAAFLVSLLVRSNARPDRRKAGIVIALSLTALASLTVWLPTDIMETREAIQGKALAGETPSIPAYFGKLIFISGLILSIPVVALVYFRLSLMDRYVIHSFLTPFTFCFLSFMAIWVIADLTDNGNSFDGLSMAQVITFYVVQVPFVVLFVMPIAILLSGLSALSKMSKSNELVSMIGAGRSVTRILFPLFVIGAYTSLIGMALKYQWAPISVGYKDAILESAKKENWGKELGNSPKDGLWSRRGWMHVNEVDRRTWFVGRVPLVLSDEMRDVVVVQLDEQDQPVEIWIASRAKWVWNSKPAKWILNGVLTYTYDADGNPLPKRLEQMVITDWSETPWKVLSSSQNPEHLGIPGLTMYLNANSDLDDRSLAPFRTNWWFIFSEPFACLVLILVSAPLGIAYSRRGSMAGVTGTIIIFALMYMMRGTFLAMGQSNVMPPFLAAWLTNILVGGTGLVVLWFRSSNRELPKWKSLFRPSARSAPKSVATS